MAFLFYQAQKSTDFKVLKVISPSEIVVDLNKNGIEDDGEIISLENIATFSTKSNKAQLHLAQKLKLSEEDAIGLGFLAENFAKETLLDKNVKLEKTHLHVMLKQPFRQKIKNLLYSASHPLTTMRFRNKFKMTYIIIIEGKNYETMLLNSGLAIQKDEPITSQSTAMLKKNIEKVHKLNLKIFNNKSHKYHKLTCKYGIIAHNSQILPASQLPKDSKPCHFCLVKKQNTKCKVQKVFPKYYDEIPDIKSSASVFQNDTVKIFLTDFTKVLKPSNSCDTNVCRELVSEINSAQNSIDFAIYGYTKVPAIQKALENAQARGVKIRFVFDLDDKNNNIYPDTLYLSEIVTNNRHDLAPQIMHDKFFIFDGKKVLTGSANISNTDMSGFNSNAVILINSQIITNAYAQEFEQMYCGKFHKEKSKIKNKEDREIAAYFSPEDKAITNKVIPLIDNSQKYIYIPAFLITHKELAQSLINASKRGVCVRIILDATSTHTNHSKLTLLRQNGIQVKTENYAGKLHSKSIIIDDLYTIIGSMNFSKSGENVNDENLIIIKNQDVAVFYKTFFQYLWKRIPEKWLKYNARAESFDSIGSCNDGVDNDFDGKIDAADDSCHPDKKLPRHAESSSASHK